MPKSPANKAMELTNESRRLADLGQREEALAAVEQATGIYRQLAEDQPGTYLPILAASLNNQSPSPSRPGAARGSPGRGRAGRYHPPPARRGPPGHVPAEPGRLAE
jgi:hypothetical protein